MRLLLLLLVHFKVFGADLLDDKVESVFEFADGLARAGELDHLWVLVCEATSIGLDNVEIRLGVERLTELNSDVGVGLLLHEDVL